MEIYSIFVFIHLFGLAWGLGGATVSDLLFFYSIKDRLLKVEQFKMLQVTSVVVISGLAVAIISGLTLLLIQYHSTGSWPLLADQRFLAKITLVAAVSVNGFVFHRSVFPILARSTGRSLSVNKEFVSRLWLLALTGAVSVVSWYGVIILAFWKGLSQFSYGLLINVYVCLVLLASLIGYVVLTFILNPRSAKTDSQASLMMVSALVLFILIFLTGLSLVFF